jgi:hypothetical protein|tara:strand:- start:15 stop:293 length:279 start_codon:yes stop_codon:yes gene_type:complete
MTNFNDWYARTPKNHPGTRKCLEAEMQRAYEAGAASQAETLRDKFAGQALAGLCPDYTGRNAADSIIYLVVPKIYRIADAMLEARKMTGEPQ